MGDESDVIAYVLLLIGKMKIKSGAVKAYALLSAFGKWVYIWWECDRSLLS